MQKRLDKALKRIRKDMELEDGYKARIKVRKRQRNSNVDVRGTIRQNE